MRINDGLSKKINTPVPCPPKRLIVQLLLTAVFIMADVWFFVYYGIDTVLPYLQSASPGYFIGFFITLQISLLLSIILLCHELFSRPHRQSGFARGLAYISTVMAVFVIMLLVVTAFKISIARESLGTVDPDRLDFTAGPFVQLGDFSQGQKTGEVTDVTIWWFDPDKKSTGTLLFGMSGQARLMIPMPASFCKGKYTVILKNLSPGFSYYYTIPGFDKEVYSFHAVPADNDKLNIFCIGDTENTAAGRDSISMYEDVVRCARNHFKRRGFLPDLYLHTGDLVKFGSDSSAWKDFFYSGRAMYASVPFMTVLGNHELKGDGGAHFDFFFSHPRYYSFDSGPAHVLVLNPFDGLVFSANGPHAASGKKQMKFAQEVLERNRNKKWIIVAMHMPLLSTGDYNMNAVLIKQFFYLFRKNRVDVVLSGHDHMFELFHVDRKTSWGGTFYVVAGTGGSRLDSYIMSRKNRQWQDWLHDRESPNGLYQQDYMTRSYHCYGELSWGFTDITIDNDEMTVDYYRYLDLEDFLQITGQDITSWKIVNVSGKKKARHVKRYTKKRIF